MFLPSLRRDRTGGRLETKSWEAEPSAWSGIIARLRDPRRAWPVERAVAEGMERVVWVFKSVDAIAGHASALKIRRVKVKPDGEREVVEDDPLARLLNKARLNRLEKGPQFRKRLSGQVLLSSRGTFVEQTLNRRGQPIGLDLLPPGRTRPVPGRGGDLLSHFETTGPDGLKYAIDPERVLWFRDPHPLDPYRGITPMEAAGLSVDLDFLARLYNATFLRNDGRPGGVIGIDGEVDDHEMRRLNDVFGKGAHEAGKLTVLQGDLSYVDLASKPRDMAYADLARISKEEILAAFGVPESVIGNASGRTFDNAAAELHNFWTITMLPHLSLLVTGWDSDHDDGTEYEFDTDGVEVLQRAKAARRVEAREEFEAGLISADEYRAIAGYDPVELPHTRALWLPQGKNAIPTREEDAVALGIAPPEGTDPDSAKATAGSEEGGAAGGEGRPGERGAIARLQDLFDQTGQDGDAEQEEENAPPERSETKTEGGAQEQLAVALTQLGTRFVERTVKRLESPKLRKHTRHFAAEYKIDTRVGEQPLDTGRIVPVEAWRGEAELTALPSLVSAVPGGSVDDHQAAAKAAAQVAEEFAGLAGGVAETVARLDAGGESISGIIAAVRAVDTHAWATATARRNPIDAS
ncbi:phage portal protein, HK97 family [Sinosporangium album]|uniref:Phage portal protein, HK97 family n=1 Tax=Sinosporangium album TaxID=504805 RepID=A0A1G8ECR1_9ACTN|nr:phage portal protein [Sinosporangium album]SDH67745.1 phage portal protein, HK97 family [Sinosporangium album]